MMPAPKNNKFASGNKGGGRPSSYKDEFAEMAYEIALLGATDHDLARIFGVSEQTINNWKIEHEEFSLSLKRGKEFADAKVALSLFQRATGYQCPDTHFSSYEGFVTATSYTKHFPPDPTSAIFWLKNRRPNQWKDKPEGSEIPTTIKVVYETEQ